MPFSSEETVPVTGQLNRWVHVVLDWSNITPFMFPVLAGPGWLHDRSGRDANSAVGVDMIAESDVNNIKCKIGFVYETGEE